MSKIIKSATLLIGFAGVGLATASAEEVTVSKTTPYSSLEITRGNKEYQPCQHLPQEIPDDSTWAGRTEREYTNPEFKVLVGKKDFTVTPSATGGTVKYRVTTVGSKADADDESTFITQIKNKTTNTFESLNMFGRDEDGRLYSNRSVLDKGEARKVRVGTKSTTKGVVEIPYKVIDKEDATLPVG